jgi:hypothetical protein
MDEAKEVKEAQTEPTAAAEPTEKEKKKKETKDWRTLRTIKVPLQKLTDEEWRDLRRLAYVCAAYCNHRLNGDYLEKKGLTQTETVRRKNKYKDYNESLSSSVRDSLNREVQGMWTRNEAKILKGEQTLGRFSADRAICVRGDKGAVYLSPVPGDKEAGTYDTFEFELPLLPPVDNPRFKFKVWAPALLKDKYLRIALQKIVDGEKALASAPGEGDIKQKWVLDRDLYLMKKVSVIFERPGRKVFIFLSYAKKRDLDGAATGWKAELACDEAYWLSCNGHRLSLGHYFHHLINMKQSFEGLYKRLSIDLAKAGKRSAFRRQLLKSGSYEEYALGRLHQLSRHIVNWCVAEGANAFSMSVSEIAGKAPDGTIVRLPWTRLFEMLRYKFDEAGVRDVTIDNQSAAIAGRSIEQQARQIQKENLATLKEARADLRDVAPDKGGRKRKDEPPAGDFQIEIRDE